MDRPPLLPLPRSTLILIPPCGSVFHGGLPPVRAVDGHDPRSGYPIEMTTLGVPRMTAACERGLSAAARVRYMMNEVLRLPAHERAIPIISDGTSGSSR